MAENPGQEQRAFWAVLLAMAVLLLWSVIFPAKAPQKNVEGELETGHPTESVGLQESGGAGDFESDFAGDYADRTGAPERSPASGRDDGTTRSLSSESPSPTSTPAETGSLLGVLSGQGALLQRPESASGVIRETVRVEMEDITLVFDGMGARLVEAHLHAYDEEAGTHVQLIPESGPGCLGSVVTIGDSEMPLDRFTFQLVSNYQTATGREITWELPLEEITLRKTFTIPSDGYQFRVSHQLVADNVGISAWGLSWAGGLRKTEVGSGARGRGDYFQGAVHAEGKVQRKGARHAEEEPLVYPGTTYFVTSQNKYFMAAIVPTGDAQGPAKLWSVAGSADSEPSLGAEIMVERSAGGLASDRIDYEIYVGPQNYAEIKTLDLGIEDAMDLGMKWVRPLSRTVLKFLIWLHGFIPNYGFVIIIFSAAVNLLFFPLTYKSTKSMRDMSALKPQLDAMKAKYKDEPQKMSEATMKLYKSAGVNPLGGCLPILLQMPIFFALYAVLFRTIELRQEPFIFWIRDLAQPDVIFHLPFSLPMIGTGICALPIIMGVTSFFQSKMTMTDPNQKAMIYMMPVMMTVIFFTFPSGLVLYWLTSNLFTISTKFFMKPNPAVTEVAS